MVGDHAQTDVVSSRLVMLARSLGDPLRRADRVESVDEPVASAAVEVGVRETEAPPGVRVVGQVEVEADVSSRDLAAPSVVPLEDDAELGRDKAVGAKRLPGLRR